MREIKFRAWDGKYMMDNMDSINLEMLKKSVFTEDGDVFLPCVYMQYTGLKDKNGKEIYEGDIIGGFPHGTVTVRWSDKWACFESFWVDIEYDEAGVEYEKEQTGLFANDLDDCKDAWVVLGNIYETTELLKPE